jgi:hypothetical protein
MKDKIFCKKCKYLKPYEMINMYGYEYTDYYCKHPNNKVEEIKYNWLYFWKSKSFKKHPKKINKKNNCKMFKSKQRTTK